MYIYLLIFFLYISIFIYNCQAQYMPQNKAKIVLLGYTYSDGSL